MRLSTNRTKRCKRWAIFFAIVALGNFILSKIFSSESNDTSTSVEWDSRKESSTPYPQLFSIGQEDIGQVAGHFFPVDTAVYVNGIVYDLYSIRELGQTRPGQQWLAFPLPDETTGVPAWTPSVQSFEELPFPRSPITKSTLAYVDQIYVITDPKLGDRIENIKRMFDRHQVPLESIEWRMGKWNRATCLAAENKEEVYRLLNLIDQPLGKDSRYCGLTIKHVELWREIARRNSPLSLILEDDAVFVPFFKEKFNRFVYTAIRTGALRINPEQCAAPRRDISSNEWIEQDPAFIIGTCHYKHDPSFQAHLFDASPILSMHKKQFSRCAHAYLLTSCSARALIWQLEANKTAFLTLDRLQVRLGQLSHTLQPFWLDPPIVYQGNQVINLEGIESFNMSTP